MDIPTPTPPPPISGYRSRAINAAVAYASALRPVAGPGIRVADGPGGKTISVDPRSLPDAPRPWTVRAVPLVGAAPSQVEWRVRVWAGLVVADGAPVEGPEPGGVDEATGLEWHDAPEGGGGEAPWLCVEVADSDSAADAASGSNAWRLAWRSEAAGETWRAIAHLDDPGPPPRLAQLDVGVVDLGDAAHHFGDAEDAETRTAWEQSEEVPAILELDNETKYKVLVDSRGNIISWTSGEGGEEPETPAAPTPPPACGNPLNETVDSNPLDGEGAGGGNGREEGDDYNPLNYEGDGGYTPKCGGEEAA
jgi:hypothetical protein